jgi:hypothetical protein
LGAAELSAQRRDLGDRETDVRDARGREVVLQFGHVDSDLAKFSVDRVKSLGLEAMKPGTGVGCGSYCRRPSADVVSGFWESA